MTEVNELYHHGIKGQRWGVRRFQNADGTLTKSGRARYKAYKKDIKEYNKLNRHVSASQKHLKEEGVMLNRVRDVYEKRNLQYQKEMSKSSGFLGLKAAKKATKVANAQMEMDKAASEYDKAAGAYGMAKRISRKDTKALVDKANSIVQEYGKGSIKDVEYETVKIGQNKLQKIMQGAPLTSILGKKRDTDVFVKTGKTLADMPVIGNMYTANYIAKEEFKMKTADMERTINNNGAKRKLSGKNGAEYLKEDYFDNASSKSTTPLDVRKAKRKAKKTEKSENRKAEAAAKAAKKQEALDEIDKKLAEAGYVPRKEQRKKNIEEIDKQLAKEHYVSRKQQIADNKRLIKEIEEASKKAKKEDSKTAKELARYNERAKTLEKEIEELKKRNQSVQHSYRVVRKDELYHHGIKGQRWGVRRFQNKDGTLTPKGKKHYYKHGSDENAEYDKKIRKTNTKIGAAVVGSAAGTVGGVFAAPLITAATGNPTAGVGVAAAIQGSSMAGLILASGLGSKKIKDLDLKIDPVKDAKAVTKAVEDIDKMSPKERAKFYQNELNAYDKWEASGVSKLANLSKEYRTKYYFAEKIKSGGGDSSKFEADMRDIVNKSKKLIEAHHIYEKSTNDILKKLEKDKDLVYRINTNKEHNTNPRSGWENNYYQTVKGNSYKVRVSNKRRQKSFKWTNQVNRKRRKGYTPVHTEYHHY